MMELPRVTVTDEIASFVENGNVSNLDKSDRSAAEHATTDFKAPLYNVWKFKSKSTDLTHFGNSEPTILDNLLYLYTSPFDVVLDPFARRRSSATCRMWMHNSRKNGKRRFWTCGLTAIRRKRLL